MMVTGTDNAGVGTKNQGKGLTFWIPFTLLIVIYVVLLIANRNSLRGWIIVLGVFVILYSLRRFFTRLKPWVTIISWIIIAILLVIPFGATISPSLPSLQARVFKSLLLYEKRHQGPLPEERTAFVKALREYIANTAKDRTIRQGINIKEVDAGGVPAEWVFTKDAPADKAVLYIHGGGFAAGSARISRTMSQSLASYSGVKVLAIDYRLAPEHLFPAGLEDCVGAYRWLLSQGIPPAGIIIAGDSAGGNLALAAALVLKAQGEKLPAGLVVISPATDLAATGESLRTRARDDPILDPMMHKHVIDCYLPKGPARADDVKNPLVSPLYGEFSNFPPVLIEVGTEEILLDDSRRLARKLRDAGVDVTLREWNGLWHVFPYITFLPEAKRACREMGDFIRMRVQAPIQNN